jgi:tricorn protease-like protein
MLDYNEWKDIVCKRNLTGNKALEAVRKNAHALQYVNEQTEEICLEAVRKYGGALKYVEEKIFNIGKVAVSANGKTVYISKESYEALGL